MELEGLKRIIARLDPANIAKLVTDRHKSIAKYIRIELPNVLHRFDAWHVSKGTLII